MAGFNFNHKPKNVPFVSTKYRRIATKIPNPESVEMLDRAYKMETRAMHGQMPVVWDCANDFQVFDAFGKTKSRTKKQGCQVRCFRAVCIKTTRPFCVDTRTVYASAWCCSCRIDK